MPNLITMIGILGFNQICFSDFYWIMKYTFLLDLDLKNINLFISGKDSK